jgi:hypothetical protein
MPTSSSSSRSGESREDCDLLGHRVDDPRAVRKIVWFVVLAYALSWSWWIPLAISGTVVDRGP